MKIKDEYRGGLYALGGVSSGTQHGGSGTVYIEEIQGDKLFRRLYIDNQNANPPKVFTLDEMNPKTVKANATEENDAEFGFDELMLQRGVSSSFFFYLDFRYICSIILLRWVFVDYVTSTYLIFLSDLRPPKNSELCSML